MRSFKVMFSRSSYLPGCLTNPFMVTYSFSLKVCMEYTTTSSSLRSSKFSFSSPSRAFPRSKEITSLVRSGLVLIISALPMNASSQTPPALRIRSLTLIPFLHW